MAVYLPFPTLADAQARSAAEATARGCDGVLTKYWWECKELTAAPKEGEPLPAVMVMQPGTDYGLEGLSDLEKARVVTVEDSP
jgi:hypothetical protein